MRHARQLFCAILCIFFSVHVVATSRAGVPVQQAKLLPSDGEIDDNFGTAVALDGNTALICAPETPFGTAYVFKRSDMRWTEHQKLTGDAELDGFFGSSVSMDGGTAVFGAPGYDDNGVDSGAAFVFVVSGGVWTEQAKLLPADGAANDSFGQRVAVDGDTVVVGAHKQDPTAIANPIT